MSEGGSEDDSFTLTNIKLRPKTNAHTPQLISPPVTGTPPTVTRKREARPDSISAMETAARSSTPVDANALNRRLSDEASKRRERTPVPSPARKRQRIYGDRFIPNRQGEDFFSSFHLLNDESSSATPSKSKKRPPHGDLHFQRTEEANRTFSNLLRSEMFDLSPDTSYGTTYHDPSRSYTPPRASSSSHLAAHTTPSTPHKNFFSYRSPHLSNPTPSRTPKDRHGPNLNPRSELYSLSPVKLSSQQMLLSPRKTPRQVPKIPYKVLDAPDLADDFYLNLVDWGQSNSLAVGLGKAVYMWNSQSGRVVKLCELPGDDSVTSVNWIQRGSHLAIGTHKGTVQIWDANYQRRLRTMTGHTARVGALAWNEHILTSGSRDRLIYHRDVRAPDQFLTRLIGHKQEVCGLKWNTQDGQLASGGNDNKLLVWDKLNSTPLHKFAEHSAAVKAIAWSPHQRGLLASGGGTADRKLRFWNTIVPQNNSYHQNNMFSSVNNSNNNNHFNPSPSPSTNDASSSSTNPHLLQTLDTGSQICNLLFSKTSNELVSTHGYSQNQIVVWKYPSLQQVVSLTGHTYRVLYLAMSPDGRVIVTGAGDETLRFWKLFGADNPGPKKGGGSRIGSLDRLGAVIR